MAKLARLVLGVIGEFTYSLRALLRAFRANLFCLPRRPIAAGCIAGLENRAPGVHLVCCLAYLYQIVVGIPAFLLFSRKTQHRLWPYLLLGFAAGAGSLVAVTIARGDLSRLYFSIGLMGILGACTALVFWLVARPDKRSITTNTRISK